MILLYHYYTTYNFLCIFFHKTSDGIRQNFGSFVEAENGAGVLSPTPILNINDILLSFHKQAAMADHMLYIQNIHPHNHALYKNFSYHQLLTEGYLYL